MSNYAFNTYPQALTIAGSDSGGGAGIQADLKTFQMRKVFGTSVITAVTAQNTQGVWDIHPIPLSTIKNQLKAIAEDFNIQAFKIGMLGNADIINCVAESLQQYQFGRLVLDPVMIAKGGAALLTENAIESLKTQLLPLADLITPNLPEVKVLTGIDVINNQTAQQAASKLQQLGVQNILIKGGHTECFAGDESNDWLFTTDEMLILPAKRFNTPHTHGTGCTLSACITAELAKGHNIKEAVITAKKFITAAISHPLNIGHKYGPVNHWAFQQFSE